MEEPLPQEILLMGDFTMFSNNGNDGILLANAFGNMMGDQVFRQIMGMKLLADENRMNDGVGMALIMNSTSPINKPMIQPPTLGTIYGRR